ncbi:MAG TPA: maleylacetate reductase [Stellaceae bacterium]|nr:maleylacetate reductase [Stellaceae bacterium]
MRSFTYDQLPTRVVFGTDSIERLADEVSRLGATRALVLSTPGQRRLGEEAAHRLGALAAGIYAEAVMHVPAETARAALEVAQRIAADCLVAVGGGSTVGLAKAIARDTGIPIVAIPTTYAGSEMTPIFGITEAGVKRTGRDRRVLPRAVLYDPQLTLALPAKISATSGMNALAHCVEALYAPDGNPIVSLMAAEGIRALARALPIIVADGADLEARGDALYGAWLAGTALGATTMGLHHKLCHTLGGSFNLPHAEVHTIILPHATAYNREAAPHAMRTIAAMLGADDAAQGLYDLAQRIGAPLALRDIGMPADGIDRATELATANPYANPRPVDYADVKQLLDDAFRGARPA